MKKMMMTCAFAAVMLVGAQSVQAQSVVDGQTAKELAEKAKIAKAADKAQAAVVKAEKKVESAKKAIEKAKHEVFPDGIPQIQIVRTPVVNSKTDLGCLKRTPANGVLTEEEMAEAQERVDAMKLVTK